MLQSADILNIYMSDVMSLVVQFILVVCKLLGNCFHSGSSALKTSVFTCRFFLNRVAVKNTQDETKKFCELVQISLKTE